MTESMAVCCRSEFRVPARTAQLCGNEPRTLVPVPVPSVFFDIALELCSLLPAAGGNHGVIPFQGNGGKLLQDCDQEES
jgi:hypothetical protein